MRCQDGQYRMTRRGSHEPSKIEAAEGDRQPEYLVRDARVVQLREQQGTNSAADLQEMFTLQMTGSTIQSAANACRIVIQALHYRCMCDQLSSWTPSPPSCCFTRRD